MAPHQGIEYSQASGLIIPESQAFASTINETPTSAGLPSQQLSRRSSFQHSRQSSRPNSSLSNNSNHMAIGDRCTSFMSPAEEVHRPIALRFNNMDNVEDSQLLELPNHLDDDDVGDYLFLDAPADSNNNSPVKWGSISPDLIMAKMKQLKPEPYEGSGLRSFYKSYNSWEKMATEQKNKAVAWFRKINK